MSDKWDRVDASIRRVHDDLGFRQVRVYNFERTYDEGTGDWEYTRVEASASPIEAEVREPTTPRETTTAGGTTSEIDAEIRPRDDHGIDVVPAGESDRPTEVESVEGDGHYSITEGFLENNGVEKWSAVEE